MTYSEPITVLVVNDNGPQNYALAQMLRRDGCAVLRAFSGSEALLQARKRPQVILMDVNMPDMLGFEVCSRLKSDPATAGIPVIFISATYQYPTAQQTGTSVGGGAFLFYPVEQQQ